MRVADKINLGKVGKGMLIKVNPSRSGADPPKNASGSTDADVSNVTSWSFVRSGNGSCIMATKFSNPGPFMLLMEIWDMRSRHSTAAMMLSKPSSTSRNELKTNKVIGKGGQISSDVLVDVFAVQRTCSSRRRGDPKTISRHLRHTCVSLCHRHEDEKPPKGTGERSSL